MTAKELRQNIRRGSFVVPFIGVQLVAVVAMAAEFQVGHASGASDFNGMLNPYLLVSSGPFWAAISVICLLIMPLGGLLLIGQEIEEGNHELLLLTKLRRWRVVVGKIATLWGLCTLTFISLLPFVVVRYMVGGIEWWHESACGATILGGSAILCAGTIGASAFKRIGARIAVLGLFIASVVAGCAIPLVGAAMATGGCGWLYHVTALSAVACYTVIGLALARSRLRLALMAYEANPSGMIIALLVFCPFVTGFVTATTGGYGGAGGLIGIALIVWRMDLTPQLPPSMPAPPPNLPVASAQETAR